MGTTGELTVRSRDSAHVVPDADELLIASPKFSKFLQVQCTTRAEKRGKKSFPRGVLMQHLAPLQNPELSNGHVFDRPGLGSLLCFSRECDAGSWSSRWQSCRTDPTTRVSIIDCINPVQNTCLLVSKHLSPCTHGVLGCHSRAGRHFKSQHADTITWSARQGIAETVETPLPADWLPYWLHEDPSLLGR